MYKMKALAKDVTLLLCFLDQQEQKDKLTNIRICIFWHTVKNTVCF